jgi:chromosome segregation ATPase
MNISITIIIGAVIAFGLANLVLWIVLLLGTGKEAGKPEANKNEEALLASTINEMLDIYKDVEDMVDEIKSDNKKLAVLKPELPEGFAETINKDKEEIKKLNDSVKELKSSISTNTSRMENLQNLLEDLDSNLVKISGLVEKTTKE